ncbi:hypothetical protein BJX61DRAFT_546027 [Aspergillus egyptiacus]|nr:hypothetical protein BJX61DRAFT_546027 [Aspergillus egyptiacus]
MKVCGASYNGAWGPNCDSSFDGLPGACSVYAPDGSETKGEVDHDPSFIGIASGADGTCSGTIQTTSDGECTKDSLVKIERRYTGKYTGDE